MKTIALLSQKGGSGKSTIAINLAIALAGRSHQIVVLDLDPQVSTTAWANIRENDNPVFVATNGQELTKIANRANEAKADYLIIDTAPKDENASLQAAKLADIILIPCQPSSLDLHAVAETVNTAQLVNAKAFFVLNNCKSSSTLTDLAVDALGSYATPIAPVQIGNRVDFVKSLMAGKGVVEYAFSSKAANEVRALTKFVTKQLGPKT